MSRGWTPTVRSPSCRAVACSIIGVGSTTVTVGRPLRKQGQEIDVEVIEVLMGDEQPVDAIGERLGGRRREETRLVLAEERVDQDPEPLGLEQEPGLPQPRQ